MEIENFFRIYIFDESHKFLPEDCPTEQTCFEYIDVRDMDELKEDLLNRKFCKYGMEYGIMLARNKCEVHSLSSGFDLYYTEEDDYLIDTLMCYGIGECDFTSFIDEELISIEDLDTLRVYSYNNQRLSIEHANIKYIDVNKEEDSKGLIIPWRTFVDLYCIRRRY